MAYEQLPASSATCKYQKMKLASLALPLLVLMAGCAHGWRVGDALNVSTVAAADLPGTLVVRVENATEGPRCIAADLLENPSTSEALIRLRRNGVLVRYPPGGLVIPPKRAGSVELAPSQAVTFNMNVLSGSSLKTYDAIRVEALVGILSSPCGGTVGDLELTWSAWTVVP